MIMSSSCNRSVLISELQEPEVAGNTNISCIQLVSEELKSLPDVCGIIQDTHPFWTVLRVMLQR